VAPRTEDVRRKLKALHHHCGALGRDPVSVLQSHMALPLVLAETKAALTRKVEGAKSGTAFQASQRAWSPRRPKRRWTTIGSWCGVKCGTAS
jgi:hypothetical protein